MDKSRHSPQFAPLTCSCGLGNGMFLPSPAPFDLTDERRRFFGAHLDSHRVSLRKALVCKNQMKERAFKSTQKSHLISSPFPPQHSSGAGRLRGNRAWNAESALTQEWDQSQGLSLPDIQRHQKKCPEDTKLWLQPPFLQESSNFHQPNPN